MKLMPVLNTMQIQIIAGAFSLLCATCVLGQTVTLRSPTLLTSCNNSMLNGTDSYHIEGFVGPNVTEYTSTGWEYSLSVKLLNGSPSQTIGICIVFLGAGGMFCNSAASGICPCDSVNASGTAHFMIISEAKLAHSQGEIHASWQHSNKTIVTSQAVYLPNVYDLANAAVEVKDESGQRVLMSDTCTFTVTPNYLNLTVCCINTAVPCNHKLSINGSFSPVFMTSPACVTTYLKSLNTTNEIYLTDELTVCKQKAPKEFSCAVKFSEEITTQVATIATATINQDDKKTDDKLDLILGLVLGLGLGIPLIIGCVYCLWKKKTKSVSGNMQKRERAHSRENAVSPTELKINVSNDSARGIKK